MRDRAGALPDPLSRALAVSTAWDMLAKGELSPGDVVATVTGALVSERSAEVVEPFLGIGLRAAEQWAPPNEVSDLLEKVAASAAALAEVPEHRQPALRTLAASASSDEHFALLDRATGDDRDLAWRVLARRAELGHYDATAVKALQDGDPDPDAAVRALGVRGARPDADAKEEVWQAVLVDRTVPMGLQMSSVAGLFWRPTQAALLKPFTERYLDQVTGLTGGGMLSLGSIMRSMFPTAVADQEFLDHAHQIAARTDIHPAVRSTLLTGADTVARILAARRVGA
jgi:aminopeptidase N